MTTGVYGHRDTFLHDEHAAHNAMIPHRLETIWNAAVSVPAIKVVDDVVPASREQIMSVHSAEYTSMLFDNAPSGNNTYALDPETVMNLHTLRAVQLSAGAVMQAVNDVVFHGGNAFCLVYGGHHAGPNHGHGFCFINNVAIAARYAHTIGCKRIAVADIDTHSGNGTIYALMHQPQYLFVETYQPGFPGKVISPYDPPSNVIRKETAPFFIGGRNTWIDAWKHHLLSAVEEFEPDIILVSAGFDAHQADPLGTPGIVDDDYLWIFDELLKIQPRLVASLEGGYSILDVVRNVRNVVELMTHY